MKKKIKHKKIYGMIVVLLIIMGIGGITYKMKIPTEHEKQVAFLKKHEKEMTEYIKSQNNKIKTVKYDWSSVKVETIGNGTPQGSGKYIQISIDWFNSNNKWIDGGNLGITVDEINDPKQIQHIANPAASSFE